MKFQTRVEMSVRACQPLIWIRTHEATEVRRELLTHFSQPKNTIFRWNLLQGLLGPGGEPVSIPDPSGVMGTLSGQGVPLVMAIGEFLRIANRTPARSSDSAMFLLVDNFHFQREDLGVLQALQDFTAAEKKRACSIVLVAHYDQAIVEDLKSCVTFIPHDLPDLEGLKEIADGVMQSVENSLTELLNNFDTPMLETVARAGLGLSRLQFESQLAEAITTQEYLRQKSKNPQALTARQLLANLVADVHDRKADLFNAEKLIKLYRPSEKVEDMAGMEGLLRSVQRRFARQSSRFRQDRFPKGLLLLGPGGTGKTTIAKAIANMLGKLLAVIDTGSLKDKHVGVSEGRIRRMFEILRAMGDVVAYIDEIGKVFPSGRELDSGVSNDQLAVWLDELADHSRRYYMLASANEDLDRLPGPILRSGRFDNLVMIDIPKPETQKRIWAICRKKFGIPEEETTPEHHDWTGAEIEGCCNQADAEGITLLEAAKMIVPIARRKPEEIRIVRNLAHLTTLDAETWEIYKRPEAFGVTVAEEKPDGSLVKSTGFEKRRPMRSNPEAN